jgi:hypothetical protein
MKKRILNIVFAAAIFLSVLFAAFWVPNSSPAKESGTVTYVRVCDPTGCYIYEFTDGVMTGVYPE